MPRDFFFELTANLDEPLASIWPILRVGRNAYFVFLQHAQVLGVNHVATNLKGSRRPARVVLEELAQYVLPLFPSLKS